MNKFFLLFAAVVVLFFIAPVPAYAAGNTLVPNISVSVGGTDDPAEVVPALQVLFLVSIIALAPSLLMMLTGFTRIVITLHFIRAAMGTQQMPPNQVLIGVALILTLFLMSPILGEINDAALQPLSNGEISIEQAFEQGMAPLRKFMLDQTDDRDIALFEDLSGQYYDTVEELPYRVIIPAFILGELTKGFVMGFVLYLPFIVIDMVVASVLMAMGMMMLPPAMISMPFKILLFILSGGWTFVINYVMQTFYFS
jgi:flagellar biosynthetic protein FliP